MTKIVVLLSTYNGEKYLKEQIDSILKQTVSKDIYLFVRDDGSKDNTVNILEEYKNKKLLFYYIGKNLGSTNSFFDLLIKAPKADFYAFADQDDYWFTNKLEFGVNEIKEITAPVLFYSKKCIVNQDLKPIDIKDLSPKFDIFSNFIFPNSAYGCTMVFNRALYDILVSYPKLTNLPKEKYREVFHDSWTFKTALLLGKIVYSEKDSILYRQHKNNSIGAAKEKNLFSKIKDFDFSLSRYRNLQFTTIYANLILDAYKNKLKKKDLELIDLLANAKHNYKKRLSLFFYPGPKQCKLYEVIWAKIKILFGWL